MLSFPVRIALIAALGGFYAFIFFALMDGQRADFRFSSAARNKRKIARTDSAGIGNRIINFTNFNL